MPDHFETTWRCGRGCALAHRIRVEGAAKERFDGRYGDCKVASLVPTVQWQKDLLIGLVDTFDIDVPSPHRERRILQLVVLAVLPSLNSEFCDSADGFRLGLCRKRTGDEHAARFGDGQLFDGDLAQC